MFITACRELVDFRTPTGVTQHGPKKMSSATAVTMNNTTLLRCFMATLCLLLEFLVCRLLYSIPLFHFFVEKQMERKAQIKMAKDTYWDSLFGWKMFKECWKMRIMDLRKRVSEGKTAVNSTLVSSDGRTCVQLLELVHCGRPLVLNFGSSS